jgi:threonine dehydrogenase-like Zn-dependent dehydrogenase
VRCARWHHGTVRAVVVTGPDQVALVEVPEPAALPGEVVVEVARVGLCGTDAEMVGGEMSYLRSGHTRYPVRIGHEWCGTVVEVGEGVDRRWQGRRVTGDTMLGCGACRRCRRGHQHVCEQRQEVGIRGDRPGALGERLAVPSSSLHELPDAVDDVAGALVEPGANAWRTARATATGTGDRALVVGPGTIGLLVAAFLAAEGVEVHLQGVTSESLAFACHLGHAHVWTPDDVPDLPFDAVVDAATDARVAAAALDRLEPGGRFVGIGIAHEPSTIDTRTLVLGDLTAVGVLSGSGALEETIAAYAAGVVDPRPLVAATVSLADAVPVLMGQRPDGGGRGPKVHVDPRR